MIICRTTVPLKCMNTAATVICIESYTFTYDLSVNYKFTITMQKADLSSTYSII